MAEPCGGEYVVEQTAQLMEAEKQRKNGRAFKVMPQ
jgi:hypothetical protein